PVSFYRLRFRASDEVLAAMLLDEGRDIRDIGPEALEVVNGKIKHEVGLHRGVLGNVVWRCGVQAHAFNKVRECVLPAKNCRGHEAEPSFLATRSGIRP